MGYDKHSAVIFRDRRRYACFHDVYSESVFHTPCIAQPSLVRLFSRFIPLPAHLTGEKLILPRRDDPIAQNFLSSYALAAASLPHLLQL